MTDRMTAAHFRDLSNFWRLWIGDARVATLMWEEAARREAEAKALELAIVGPGSAAAPCETCNDDPYVCAEVPGLRHCEKAQREDKPALASKGGDRAKA